MTFPSAPAWGLLAGAATWGLIWYPYRLLAQAGIDGLWSTLFTYGLALVIGVLAFPRHARGLARMPALAWLMGAAIGWSNLAYVLGVLEGEVMRVLLLFYLAPLWTVPLARLFLHERLDRRGMAVMALAFAGAMAMLWHGDLGIPWPASRAEWLGLAAGFLFALGNVLVRRLRDMTDPSKTAQGTVASVMDYCPAYIVPKDWKQGDYFTSARRTARSPRASGIQSQTIVVTASCCQFSAVMSLSNSPVVA